MRQTVRTIVTTLILVLIIAAAAYFLMQRREGGAASGTVVKDTGANISDYSAVFLTNGQVYFGKISEITETEIDMNDIYYLQVSQQNLQSGNNKPQETQNPDVSLVKLGNELHGPNDRMRVNRDHVLFTESLKDDSQVVKAIEDFKKK